MQEKAPARHAQYQQKLKQQINMGSAEGIKEVAAQMRTSTREMKRSLRSLAVVQNGLNDSTRNMVRSYVSLFALFEGTTAIKRVGQQFQGYEAAMLAASGSVEASKKDMIFLNGIVDQMGLSLGDTTDAWVKFKFAAKGKITQGEQESLFESLSMFGTALKVGSEDMKRAQRGLIQMMSKGQIMAKSSLAL